jgi:hypothetical protein
LPNRTQTARRLRSQAADRSSPWLRRASYSGSPALSATSSSPGANSPSSASVGASWSPRRRSASCSAWRLSTAESLPGPRSDAVRPASFPRRSQPRLLTGAIRGGLLAPPARRQRTACLHLFHSAARHRTAPARPTNYRSGHTYAAAFERNATCIFSSRFSRSSSRSRTRSEAGSAGWSSACASRYSFSRGAPYRNCGFYGYEEHRRAATMKSEDPLRRGGNSCRSP